MGLVSYRLTTKMWINNSTDSAGADAALSPSSSSSDVSPVPATTHVRYFVGCKSYDGLPVRFFVQRVLPETVGELIESALPRLGLKVPVGHTMVYNVDPAIIKDLVNATAEKLSDEVPLDALLEDVAPKRPSGRMNGVYLYVDVPPRVTSSSTAAAISGTCHSYVSFVLALSDVVLHFLLQPYNATIVILAPHELYGYRVGWCDLIVHACRHEGEGDGAARGQRLCRSCDA
jgi:hypothetical protein